MFPLLFEVLDYQPWRVGKLCLYKNRAVPEDGTNECAYVTWKAGCHCPLCR